MSDPVIAALAALSSHFGRPVSADTIASTLPLQANSTLAAMHVPEAAERAGLWAQAGALTDETLAALALPAIGLRKHGGACVLLKRRADEIFVLDAATPTAGAWHAIDSVLAELEPAGFFVRARVFGDSRAWEALPEPAHGWFREAVTASTGLYGLGVVLSTAINVLAALAAMYVMAVYDRVIPNRALDTLWVLTSGVLLVYLFDLLFKSTRGYVLDVAARRFDVVVGTRLYARALALEPADRPTHAGALVHVLRDYETLRDFFTAATLVTLGDLPFLVLFLGILAWMAGSLAWVPLLGVPLMLAVVWLFVPSLARATEAAHRVTTARTALLHETLAHLDGLRAAGGQGWARQRWEGLLLAGAETAAQTRHLAQWSGNLSATLQAFIATGVVVVAALLVADGRLSTGAMVACSILTGRALAPLAQIAQVLARWQAARQAYEAVNRIMTAAAPTAQARLHLPALAGGVALRDVRFTYPGGQEVLAGLTVTVRPGERVAILGRVGSGKSTLLALVAGLMAPSAGQVLLDGIEIRQIAESDLRAYLGFAGQEAVLFSGTLRENITLGRPGASDVEVLRALEVAGLEEWLATVPEGLGAQVGENGCRLSGGTRQGVALARAVLNDPPLLVLDEPTSQMDQQSEQRLLERLARARQGRTTLIVTHRPAVLAAVDRVWVMERGTITVDGPRDEVVAALAGR